MNNIHHYNRYIYLGMRIGVLLIIFGLVGFAAAVSFYSAKGDVYNPVFLWPAALFNYMLGVEKIPSSTAEFSLLSEIPDNYSIGDMIVFSMYLFIATMITFFIILNVSKYIVQVLYDYCLKYKLGAEGARVYKNEQMKAERVKRENNKAISDLESAEQEYWLQWKKFYKSDLGYEEWKKKIIKN